MNEFIEKNRGLLKIYYIAALIMGWTILIKVGIDVILFLIGHSRSSSNIGLAMFFINSLLLGFIALGVGRFIRYLYDMEYQAGGLLRCIDKIIYLYAIAKVAQMIFLYISLEKRAVGAGPYFSMWGSFTTYAMPAIAFILVLVGLGLILRRIIPIIQEYKSLV